MNVEPNSRLSALQSILKDLQQEFARVHKGKDISSDEIVPACAHVMLKAGVETPLALLALCDILTDSGGAGQAAFTLASFTAAVSVSASAATVT